MDLRVSPDAAAAAADAARFVARSLTDATRRRGRASLAVSGGSTPAAMFDVLARLDVPWSSVTVFQVDERVAPDGHPDRNAVQLREHLVDRIGLRGRQVRWMPVAEPDIGSATRRYAGLIDAIAPIDVVHLGLGDDGHTASWPPGDPVVDSAASVALSACFNGRRRMTLTPRPVNGARRRVILVAGADKAAMVARYLADDRSIPVSSVRRTGSILFLDESAAADLHRR